MMQRDMQSAVTPADPGGSRDRQFRVTTVMQITAYHQSHSFTLVLRGGAIAVLHVHGLLSQEEARAFAASVLPTLAYEVVDGDITSGHAEAFHAWTCTHAQEYLPKRHASH